MTAGLHMSEINNSESDIDNSESDISIDNNSSMEEQGVDNNTSTEEQGMSSFAACNPFETLLGGAGPRTPAQQDLDLLFDTGSEEKDQESEMGLDHV
jgi:hypothetical protein